MRPAWMIAFALAGCTGGKTGPRAGDDAEAPIDDGAAPIRRTQPEGPSIESEVGALDPEAVEASFNSARAEVPGCFERANADLDFAVVGGDIEVLVRVASDGSVRWLYAASSDVGHLGAERCILDAVKKQPWPKPEGGDEGIARTRFGLDPPGRAPVGWSSADLGSGGGALAAKLASCKRQSGTASISVTVYVDADGRAFSAGVAVGDERGIDAVDCAVSAAKAQSYASPGSYPAKVTVTSD